MNNIAVIILSLFVLPGCEKVVTNSPKNILFIAIDDLRPELKCYGQDYVHSPNIDRLAENGAVFQRAYCSVSWCAPSRTALMTGLRPSTTDVMDLKTHFRKKLPNVVTLPQFFKEKGYTSLGFGKLYHNDSTMQDRPSWNEPCWIPEGEPILAYATEENQQIAAASKYNKATATEAADVPEAAYPDGQVAQKAIQTLKELKSTGNPFFLGVGFYKPHLPFTAPKKYWDLYDQETIPLAEMTELPQNASEYIFREWSEPGSYAGIKQPEPYPDSLSRHLKHGYLACVSFIDAQVGKLLNELENQNLAENTIVVIWGDHGWKLGEYGRWSKHSNMEIDTRVPLIIYVPGDEPKVVADIVESIDIYPTLAELAGFEIPQNLAGENLFHKKRNFAISEIPRDSVTGHSIRTKDFRYIEWRKNENGKVVDAEFYDHRKEEPEKINKADLLLFETVIDSLQVRLKTLIKQ